MAIAEEQRAMNAGKPAATHLPHTATAAAAIFALGAATLLGAWYFQYVLGLPPCPLCLEQRIPYYIIIPLTLVLTLAALWRAPRRAIALGFVVVALAALCGAALAAYHAGVEWRWWPGPTDCSGPIVDFTSKGSLLEQLKTTHVVRCDEAAWRFLGLSLAGYNVLISLAMAAIAVWGARAAWQAWKRQEAEEAAE